MATRKRPAARAARGSRQLTLDAPAEVPSRTLVEEVEAAFLEYSMSVIVSRALPDVRDGTSAGASSVSCRDPRAARVAGRLRVAISLS